jgi:hypothetical protein
VSGALLELAGRRFRGEGRKSLRDLRPLRKSAPLGALGVVLAYFLWQFFRVWRTLREGLATLSEVMHDLGGTLPWLTLAMAMGASAVWVFASSTPAPRLSEAEIHLLLPAPIPRRRVLAYVLWKEQTGVLWVALGIVCVRGTGPPGQRLTRLFGTWALLTLCRLHSKGVSLWKARLSELSAKAARRQVATAVTLLAGFWGLLLWSFARTVSSAASGRRMDGVDTLRQIAAASATGLQGALLAPFAWIGRPLIGDLAQGWLVLYLLLVLAAHYEWVLRARGFFERTELSRGGLEPTVVRSRRRVPFALSPVGRPEMAIFWKGSVAYSRASLGRLAALFFLPSGLAAAILVMALALGPAWAMAGLVRFVAGTALGLLLVLPLVHGLLGDEPGRDLRVFEVLRPWPIAGWRLFAAELLAPGARVLAALAGAFGALAAAAVAARIDPDAGEGLRSFPGGHAAGPITLLACGYSGLWATGSAVALLSLAIQQHATLILPGWLRNPEPGRKGAAIVSQRVLLVVVHLLALAAALVAPALLVGGVLRLQALGGGAPTIHEGPLMALLVTVVVLAEVGLLVRVGGARWDRFDPSRGVLAPGVSGRSSARE